MIDDVLQNPEVYLRILRTAYLIVFFLFSWVSGFLLYRTTRRLSVAIFYQAVPLAVGWYGYLLGLTMAQEFLQLSLGLLLAALVAPVIFQPEKPVSDFKLPVVIGLISGLGMASKIIFLPVLMFGVFFIPGWKRRIIVIAVSIAVFSLAILPFERNLSSLFALWTPEESQNILGGTSGWIEKTSQAVDRMATNIVSLASNAMTFKLIGFGVGLFVFRMLFVMVFKMKVDPDEFKRSIRTSFSFIMIFAFASALLSLRKYEWYFMPMLGAVGLFLSYEIHQWFVQIVSRRSVETTAIYPSGFGLGIIALLLIGFFHDQGFYATTKNLISTGDRIKEQSDVISEISSQDVCVILSPGSCHPAGARWHAALGYTDGEFNSIIAKYQPDNFYWMFANSQDEVFRISESGVSKGYPLDDILRHYAFAVFHGSYWIAEEIKKKYPAIVMEQMDEPYQPSDTAVVYFFMS